MFANGSEVCGSREYSSHFLRKLTREGALSFLEGNSALETSSNEEFFALGVISREEKLDKIIFQRMISCVVHRAFII